MRRSFRRRHREQTVKKHLFAKIILTISSAICFAFGLAACSDDEERTTYDYRVTFDYNVGSLADDCPDQYLGVKEGGRVAIQPGYSDTFKEQVVTGYYNEGWYLAQTDGDGNPVVGEDQRVTLGKKWDFATDRVTSDITLYANLIEKPTLTIVGGDEDIVWDALPGAVRRRPSTSLQPKKENATFYGYYEDEQCTKPFVWESECVYTYEAGVHTTVYARFLEGNWTIVKTAQEFSTALNGKTNIYVDDHLDFSDVSFPAGREYAGEINGNGKEFRNIDCTVKAQRRNSVNFGLFGVLKSTANLHDFTIVDASMTFHCDYNLLNYKAALFVWQIESGAKLTNLTVTGTMKKGTIDERATGELFGFCGTDGGAVIENCHFEGITVQAE